MEKEGQNRSDQSQAEQTKILKMQEENERLRYRIGILEKALKSDKDPKATMIMRE